LTCKLVSTSQVAEIDSGKRRVYHRSVSPALHQFAIHAI
jgi:hypothetical protein